MAALDLDGCIALNTREKKTLGRALPMSSGSPLFLVSSTGD